MKRHFFLLAALLAGCAASNTDYQRVAQLHVGMTTQEVTALLGQPRSITSQGALVVYDYPLRHTAASTRRTSETSGPSYYVIVGRDGRVQSYGPN
jgi:outer membrane protein assembly factor BamE (lipoprotein component of BamABCDE complex)